MNFDSRMKAKYEWLNGETAQKIVAIAKKHNADSVKRLAQERGALNKCKVLVEFNRHSWLASNTDFRAFAKEVHDNGLEVKL